MPPDIIRTLEHALLRHPDLNQLCREARVSRQSVWRFLRGDRGLSLLSAARLCAALGLDLKAALKRKRDGALHE